MNYFKEPSEDNSKTFKLIGSQISLTPRSDKQNLIGCHKKYRPCSAALCFRTETEHHAKYPRPKSAEYGTLSPHSKPLCSSESPFHSPSGTNLTGDPSLRLSHFTDLSSRLLQNLLGNSSSKVSKIDGSSCVSSSLRISTAFKPEAVKVEKHIEMESENEILNSNINLDCKKSVQEDSNTSVNKEGLESIKALPELPEVAQEKMVKFSEWHSLNFHPEKKFNHEKSCACCNYKKNYRSCLKNDFESFFQKNSTCQWWQKGPEKTNILKLETQTTNSEVKSGNDIKTSCLVNEDGTSRSKEKNEEICYRHWESFSKENDNNKLEKTTDSRNKNLELSSSQSNLQVENMRAENNSFGKLETSIKGFTEETHEENKSMVDEENLKLHCAHQKADLTDSAYEEIVHLLQTLDEEDSESLNLEDKEEETLAFPELRAPPLEKIDYLSTVSSYLEEIETEDDKCNVNYDPKKNWSSKNIISPRLEELLNKNSVELAHEVFSLKIQIEDQKKGIKLLRDTLAEMKEAKKSEELEHQEALHKVSSEAEALVQRHQKFIRQLLNEKKNLNETVSKLVQDLKSGEEKYKKNIKAIEEKHSIEIKRAKEAQAVAEKIKREKWMENKTKKIKEMTVKGLEPELSRMAARQQEEMTELRNLHKAELEAVELRAARRNAELMDELRAELTKEKERAIAKEVATLRAALEKDFEEEKNKLQQYCHTLKERIRKQEERFSNQELEFQQRLIDYKQEEERNKQKIIRNHQENLEEIRRQHLVELRNLKESEDENKQVLINNYKKEQAAKFLEREAELHQQYKKERDKEIEMVIEALEKESVQIQSELNAANESKLKRFKDKMEAEIKELEVSEAALKVKLSEAKSKLSEKEDFITELNSEIRQLQTELTFFTKSCEEMGLEKAKLKEVIRGEFENSISDLVKEKENLEKEITVLKELHSKELAKKDQLNLQVKYEMQRELTRVYSRIKIAVSKKDKIIESLREENGAVNQKCRQLEFLLDQQRRNLLLQLTEAK